MNDQKRMFLINLAYWMGIGADALWAVGLFSPQVFAILTGNPDFDPDLQTRLIMGMGGSLMTGWTLLLIWAVRKPIERRVVILLTAYPVVFGMFIAAFVGFWNGNTSGIWIIIKSIVLMISMTASYVLSGKTDDLKKPKH